MLPSLELLASYEPPELDPGIEQGLRQYVERRSYRPAHRIHFNGHRIVFADQVSHTII